MKMFEVNQDMDAATMMEMRAEFEELSSGDADVTLDLGRVRFLDSSGIGGIVFLFKRLREKSRSLRLANVKGQPLNLLRQLQLGFLIARAEDGLAA